MNLDRTHIDCPLYEFDCSDTEFDIGEFYALSPNNGKLTLSHNGVSIGDFTANQQEDETINIVTPTSEDITNAVAGEALLRQQADNTLQSNINAEQLARERADRDIQSVLDGESLARSNADIELQRQIDAIASKSDVVDVVANYAALQAYDTSKLNDNDVVKVLDDETHGDTMTYYRWNKHTSTWSYIGQEAAYYSKSQMDTLLATKQDNLTAGTGIDITGTTISADTTVLATKSELSNYAEKSDTYTKTEVDNLVEPKLGVEVVGNLPVTGEENKLYLTEKAKTIQTVTGNPITVTITDGAGKMSDFRLDGDTYQQSYSGRNILPNNLQTQELNGVKFTRNADGSITIKGTATARTEPRLWQSSDGGSFVLENGQTYFNTTSRAVYFHWTSYGYMSGESSYENTSTKNCDFVYIRVENGEAIDTTIYPQIIVGSTTADYEPFVGGVSSPNPDYPQTIQTVTGEQTVTINSTDYPISLGSIELCKLGTYQDYIYKDGSDWKVHKATSKYTFDGTESWVYDTARIPRLYLTSVGLFNLGIHAAIPSSSTVMPVGISNKFIAKTFTDFYTNSEGDGFAMSTTGQNFQVGKNSWTSEAGANADIVGTVWHYGLAAGYATDTVITDSTLIAQLEAIRTASLENGSNTLSNSATGSNLAGDMEISYYGYNPTNRYDKWLWLDINNSYEQLGS